MQGHYNIVLPTENELRAAIKRYSEIVDVIHITELDVRIDAQNQGGQLQASGVSSSTFSQETDLAQTWQYGMLFNVFRENKDVIRNVTFWNTDDGDTWLDRRRENTAPNHPLLFDNNLKPKSAYYEVVMFNNPYRSSRAEMKPWTEGGRTTGKYRNLFLEAGYTQEEIDKKIADAWYRVFESSYRVYQNVGSDMAYISDVKNRDIRTEGMSYGMVLAAVRDKKDMFDRLWRWSVKYMQHKEGPRKGYFAWHCRTDGTIISDGTASDGELYYVTALLFASNRWGNDTGINYKKEAQDIITTMFSKTGEGGIYNIFNVEHKLITFTPDGTGWQYTDPSYHLPAFMEIWAEFADDGRSDFWRECAKAAREYLHKTCDPVTGINPDLSHYDGSPMGGRRDNFLADSWRVPMNIAMDFSWYNKDTEWQTGYANRFLTTLYEKYGVENFPDQFAKDGSIPEIGRTYRHSIGIVSAVATMTLMSNLPLSWNFIDELWRQQLKPYDDGYYDGYYNGLLYIFALLHLSGQYQIVLP
jgi:oligosaccharide reducing-end xylanase